MSQNHMPQNLPILYSFRRCPYAMRARMALAISQQQVKLREVLLRDKPTEMLKTSPKGTVPVLALSDTDILEESLDIMLWALAQNDPQQWLGDGATNEEMLALISETQNQEVINFKGNLDRYKYPNRYEGCDPLHHRDQALDFLQILNNRLTDQAFLFGNTPKLADMAIFPFIRQFANTNREWFDGVTTINHAQNWLARCLALPVFQQVMKKYPQWKTGDPAVDFPPAL